MGLEPHSCSACLPRRSPPHRNGAAPDETTKNDQARLAQGGATHAEAGSRRARTSRCHISHQRDVAANISRDITRSPPGRRRSNERARETRKTTSPSGGGNTRCRVRPIDAHARGWEANNHGPCLQGRGAAVTSGRKMHQAPRRRLGMRQGGSEFTATQVVTQHRPGVPLDPKSMSWVGFLKLIALLMHDANG